MFLLVFAKEPMSLNCFKSEGTGSVLKTIADIPNELILSFETGNDFTDVFVPEECLKDNIALFKAYLESRAKPASLDETLHPHSTTIAIKYGALEKVKSKWANMRSLYQRENRKVKESSSSGAGADHIFVPKWAHYKKMRFLSAGAPEAQSESTLETSQEEVDDSLEPIYEPTEQEAAHSAPPPPKRNCRRTEEAAPNRAVLLQAAVDSLIAAKEPPQPDECKTFGLMMECWVRSIPRGADRQLAMLAAHRIMVENSIAAGLVVVPEEGEN
ncbi:hypothetical protein HPB47_016368 [Ixodes persulcatus]|uniref:Uncharacterized protein n=1 Tax=Ixodes persulcatus TaxID=34615 RepID=A0AC60QR96_IXOPE|nr:hypothetical protein HPB47_016368 [Ixodes persulcatus]